MAHRIQGGEGWGYAHLRFKKKEVINICDCKRLGFVGDVEFDECTGCITHLIIPGPGCLCGIFGREKEYVIPFCDVKQIGDDIILVEVKTLKDAEKACNSG
ncbi:YlmC/YmxH family sporulation protein [Clostridiaceae bacterium]|nr:YlmC/YmxH family sporulation protein [Clostridiaceae bacterium]RKI16928.1 YlmC/YmxH family sporulation protein [bacterium 1XD21-70]